MQHSLTATLVTIEITPNELIALNLASFPSPWQKQVVTSLIVTFRVGRIERQKSSRLCLGRGFLNGCDVVYSQE